MSKNLSIELKDTINKSFQPTDYILHDALKNAVEVALALNQPLLLTGEPGTGKTKLAYKVSHDLAKAGGFKSQPYIFQTKTTSSARDLFYTYDALSHFQASNIKKDDGSSAKTADFIELQALGKAIAQTNPSKVDTKHFNTPLEAKPESSVVLIDEIDKAPRDFTNDILNEIEHYHFAINEQNQYRVSKNPDQRILVIMTSNSEKNLPDAFLRRCVFYHIPFPSRELLLDIVTTQLGAETTFTKDALAFLTTKFQEVRSGAVRKAPATAEFLAWLRILEMEDYMKKGEDQQKAIMLRNLSILVKTKEDLEAVKASF